MPSLTLKPVTSLGALALPAAQQAGAAAGVTVAERTGASICSVLARSGANARLADAVQGMFGVTLPSQPRYTPSGSVAFAWAGPSQWLALAKDTDEGTDKAIDGRAFELRLRSSLANFASIMDQSDGCTILRVSGPRARDALAKGIHIDLHPKVFGPGDAAITAVSYIGVHFWQLDAAPTYEFVVFRSFAVAFCDWLVQAAAEFGIAVGHIE